MILKHIRTLWRLNMKTQISIDNMLKKDFLIEKQSSSISQRFKMIERKNFLLNQAYSRFTDCVSDIDFISLKSAMNLHQPEVFQRTFTNNYFYISFRIESIYKNILSTHHFVVVKINEYEDYFNYSDFENLSYSAFRERMLALDKYKFCFAGSVFDKMVVLQESFI